MPDPTPIFTESLAWYSAETPPDKWCSVYVIDDSGCRYEAMHTGAKWGGIRRGQRPMLWCYAPRGPSPDTAARAAKGTGS